MYSIITFSLSSAKKDKYYFKFNTKSELQRFILSLSGAEKFRSSKKAISVFTNVDIDSIPDLDEAEKKLAFYINTKSDRIELDDYMDFKYGFEVGSTYKIKFEDSCSLFYYFSLDIRIVSESEFANSLI